MFEIKDLQTSSTISYKLVGRSIFLGGNHYVSELRLSGKDYYYDDMLPSSRAQNKPAAMLSNMKEGKPVSLEKPVQTIFYVYARTSTHAVVSLHSHFYFQSIADLTL